MSNLVRKTITLDKQTYRMAQDVAVSRDMNFSEFVRDMLKSNLYIPEKNTKSKKERNKVLGVFSLGIDKPYKNRSELYEDHLKRKFGY